MDLKSPKTTEEPKPEKYIPFAIRYSLKERKEKFQKQRQEKPNFIPIIIERHPNSTLPDIDKSRFVCEKFSKFMMVQKMVESKLEKLNTGKSLKKDGKSSLFLYVGNTIPNGEHEIQEIYEKHKAEDGFLYIKYGEMEKF